MWGAKWGRVRVYDEDGENRPIIATLEPKWRQSDTVDVQKVKCILPCRWVEAKDVKLTVCSPTFLRSLTRMLTIGLVACGQ